MVTGATHRNAFAMVTAITKTMGKTLVAMATTMASAIAIPTSNPARMKQIPRELGVMAPDFSYLKKAKPF